MPKKAQTESKPMVDGFTVNVPSTQDSTSTKSNENIQQRRKGQKGNRNKRKGTAFEHRVSAYYNRKGFTVLRARGSLGPADLIALKEGERDIYIQCKDIKSNYFNRHEMSDFISFCKRHNKRCVWAYNYHDPKKKRGKMKFINLETTPLQYVTKERIAH